MIKKLCVFCGSSSGKNSKHSLFSSELGKLMAEKNIGLVYGGASIGLMGELAKAVMENKGKVWGVIPKSILTKEVAKNDITELIVVENMHERKKRMYELADAFVALPGGYGTLDELCEILTWSQLGFHKKPIYILNHLGFFDHLIAHFKLIREEGFLSEKDFELTQVKKTSQELIQNLLMV
jgi:uncharacterized protein (TIGR00730 family)